jgi:hypothetical protein
MQTEGNRLTLLTTWFMLVLPTVKTAMDQVVYTVLCKAEAVICLSLKNEIEILFFLNSLLKI